MSNNIEVKHLLRIKRFTENEWKFITLLFYLPVGVILFLARSILGLIVFLLGYTLPDVPFARKVINKITFLSLGISVSVENIEKKENVEVYISNSLSIFDNLAVHLATGAISNGVKLQPLVAKSLGMFDFGNPSNIETLKQNIQSIKSNEKSALYFAPEGKNTNGRALIKFKAYPFSFATKVQPICIYIERPLLDISVSSLGSSPLIDIFFYMFSPLTNYKLTFLAALEKKNLSEEAFADIVRRNIAVALKVEATDLTAHDLVEWEKRQLAEQKRITAEQSHSAASGFPNLRRMAVQVKEVLPHVPLEVIYKDLYRSRNVDSTITNILEGRVQFMPEMASSSSRRSPGPSTSFISGSSSSSKIASKSISSSLNLDVLSFPKSAQERSKSFQERKRQLIANARKQYIEKHNLDIPL